MKGKRIKKSVRDRRSDSERDRLNKRLVDNVVDDDDDDFIYFITERTLLVLGPLFLPLLMTMAETGMEVAFGTVTVANLCAKSITNIDPGDVKLISYSL